MVKRRRKLSSCKYAYEATALLKRELLKRPEYKGYRIETYPPMGLKASCSIAVHNLEDILVGWLTICYGRNNELTYETRERKHTYPSSSIGDLNRFNVVEKELPLDIDDVFALIFDVA